VSAGELGYSFGDTDGSTRGPKLDTEFVRYVNGTHYLCKIHAVKAGYFAARWTVHMSSTLTS